MMAINDLMYYRCAECRRGYGDCVCPAAFTPEEREAVLRSTIASQALSGIHVERADAERWLDEVEREPLSERL
jgi:hypothetical protein